MSIFDKQTQWNDYLNSLTKKNNPILAGPTVATHEALLDPKTEADKLREALEEADRKNESVLAEMESAAKEHLSSGKSEGQKASERSGALYSLLLGFKDKQESRYDRLIEELESGNYLDSAEAKAIIDSYNARGDNAARHASAEVAGANGGNPDTYAAAQAKRQQLAFLDAGHEAAQEYYHDRLDRLLEAVRASSADIGEILSATQDNVSATDKRAESSLSIGAELLAALTKAREEGKKNTAEILSSLAKESEEKTAISPMELDREYESLTAKGANGQAAYTPVDALIYLWNKYPAMQDYLAKKYKEVLEPSYSFGE